MSSKLFFINDIASKWMQSKTAWASVPNDLVERVDELIKKTLAWKERKLSEFVLHKSREH